MPIITGNGLAQSYAHTTVFQIFHPVTNEMLLETTETIVDYMPGLNTVLLGVNNFLNQFVLTVDHPDLKFSLSRSE